MNYYIVQGNEPKGPFSLEQLKKYDITPETLVYNESMTNWTPAGNVPELRKLIFGSVTPPIATPPTNMYQQPAYTNQPIPPCPKTWLAESILVTLFCCLPFGIVGIIKAASVSSAYESGDYTKAERNSHEAKKWTLIGFFISIVSIILYIIFAFSTTFLSLSLLSNI